MLRYFYVLVLLVMTTGIGVAGEPTVGEPADTGWAFYMDNDLLAPGHRDQDYTGGFSLTRSGTSVAQNALSIERARLWLDSGLLGPELYDDAMMSRHSQEFGITTFTPAELETTAAQTGDRPYASLVYMSQSRAAVRRDKDVAYLSSLTIGILGLDAIGDAQKALHKILGSEEPRGWENQISQGGEPTFRYSLARTQRIGAVQWGPLTSETTVAVRASVGYLTQLTFGMATRAGDIHSPWWSYNPQLADYAEKTVPVAATEGADEQYLWAGFSVHARLYDAFLQGQFRHSEVTFNANELEPLVGEAWLGYSLACKSGWRYSYVLRAMSSEIKDGPGDRSLVWGGLTVSQAF